MQPRADARTDVEDVVPKHYPKVCRLMLLYVVRGVQAVIDDADEDPALQVIILLAVAEHSDVSGEYFSPSSSC